MRTRKGQKDADDSYFLLETLWCCWAFATTHLYTLCTQAREDTAGKESRQERWARSLAHLIRLSLKSRYHEKWANLTVMWKDGQQLRIHKSLCAKKQQRKKEANQPAGSKSHNGTSSPVGSFSHPVLSTTSMWANSRARGHPGNRNEVAKSGLPPIFIQPLNKDWSSYF